MTIWEYEMMIRGRRLHDLDEDYKLYIQAFIHRVVHSKNDKGNKYRYRSIKKLFDYEKEVKKIMDEGKEKPPSSILLRAIEYGRKKDGRAIQRKS